MTMTDAAAPRGLKGVIVADTALGDVRGLEGFYHYRQYSAPELAATRTFEDVWYLLFEGELPVARRARRVHRAASRRRAHLPAALLDLLPAIAGAGTPHRSRRCAPRSRSSRRSRACRRPTTPIRETIRANAMRLVCGDAGAHRRAAPGVDRARADRAARRPRLRPRTTST